MHARRRNRHRLVAAVIAACILGTAAGLAASPRATLAASTSIVISQVYGGGGNTGATLTNDFIELYNRGGTPVDVTGWTVQYASTTGTTWASTPLSGTIPPGSHYLVQEGAGAGGSVGLPTPDAVGAIALSATAGKIALVAGSGVLSGSCPSGLIDLVGYGSTTDCAEASPAGTLSNTTAALRKSAGATDTDNNASDFAVGAPDPRNLGEHEVAPAVVSTSPAAGTKNVAPGATLVVTFSEPVDVTAASFALGCSVSGSHPVAVSGGPTAFTLDPDTDFADADACTLTVVASEVRDQDLLDPPDTMAANASVAFSVSGDQEGPLATGPTISLRSGVYLSGTSMLASLKWGCTDAGVGTTGGGVQLARSTNGGASWSAISSSSVTLASSGTVQFRVRCSDAVGNWGAWSYSPAVAPRLVQQTSSAVKYYKTWTSTSSSKYSGGSAKYAKASGASATYRFTGYSVAYVTTRALNRGKVKLYLDGAYKKTLDTRLSSTRYRWQGYAAAWAAGGTHTIKLVVAGTSGRPRVDLDAFAVLLPVSTGVVTGTPSQLLSRLATTTENRTGYDRDLFVHWIDADGDGCDTRREVLIEESATSITVGSSCSLSGGSWTSAYDGAETTDPADLDIDHMVPLAEAWDSGAFGWAADRRQAFANDLGDPRSLRAVTSSSNSSKSDGDPADWLPPLEGFRCTYASEWVAVKVRWRLAVDSAERTALESLLGGCPAPVLAVTAQ